MEDIGKSESVRQRYKPLKEDWDPDLPYGGRVYLARRKKPDALWIQVLQVAVILSVVLMSYYSYYHFDKVHFHVTKMYAHLGTPQAQHLTGQRYLQGKGVEQSHADAVHWFRKAADQGHAHASYNLAVAHLKGHTDLNTGEVRKLIEHASNNGIDEAGQVLREVCDKGGCD
ncbi:PREDICTED: secretory immunoglobulin A-binding protein EsiB-like [Priapulus caudatus]|uniref:Secretory immunoglobulin A-binding protein EsiB-like n=1 Tax=Priapulus caudatus TaxID=37621 RepID=A0ABM1F8B1_PRICU|nr:PREDICTED: secretory immunoglobulin A-binding protein EsiB-like [Priapulus caudatus]